MSEIPEIKNKSDYLKQLEKSAFIHEFINLFTESILNLYEKVEELENEQKRSD